MKYIFSKTMGAWRKVADLIRAAGIRPGTIVRPLRETANHDNGLVVVVTITAQEAFVRPLNGLPGSGRSFQPGSWTDTNPINVFLKIERVYAPQEGFAHELYFVPKNRSGWSHERVAAWLTRMREGLNPEDRYTHPEYGAFLRITAAEALRPEINRLEEASRKKSKR